LPWIDRALEVLVDLGGEEAPETSDAESRDLPESRFAVGGFGADVQLFGDPVDVDREFVLAHAATGSLVKVETGN
jgi:hypothetical protein